MVDEDGYCTFASVVSLRISHLRASCVQQPHQWKDGRGHDKCQRGRNFLPFLVMAKVATKSYLPSRVCQATELCVWNMPHKWLPSTHGAYEDGRVHPRPQNQRQKHTHYIGSENCVQIKHRFVQQCKICVAEIKRVRLLKPSGCTNVTNVSDCMQINTVATSLGICLICTLFQFSATSQFSRIACKVSWLPEAHFHKPFLFLNVCWQNRHGDMGVHFRRGWNVLKLWCEKQDTGFLTKNLGRHTGPRGHSCNKKQVKGLEL